MFVRLVRENYGFEAVAAHALPDCDTAAGAVAYRLDIPEGSAAILRGIRDGYRPPEDFRYFYPWACSGPACDVSTWLRSRAQTLVFLERAGYPAPRVMLTHKGESVAQAGGWHLLATSFVPGELLRPTLDQLRSLGETVGQLHALSLDPHTIDVWPGLSYWHPDHAIPTALQKLAAVEGALPTEWRAMHDTFRASIQEVERAIRRGDLSMGVIHGDVWAANTIADATGRVALIDWSQGGVGIPLLDLGRLLLECHLDADLPPAEPLAWHIRPNQQRIAAVVDGYARVRQPGEAELGALLDAMRFGVAFIGALHFEEALRQPQDSPAWKDGMRRRFERLANRLAVSEEVAAIAVARFRVQA